MNDYPDTPADLEALSAARPDLYSVDPESGSLMMVIKDPLASDAGLTDQRDRQYIENLCTLVGRTRTLNPLFKGGELELGKSKLPVDTLHGKMDAEARAKHATALATKFRKQQDEGGLNDFLLDAPNVQDAPNLQDKHPAK